MTRTQNNETLRYLVLSFLTVLLLTIFGKTVSIMPTILLPFICLLFAIPATLSVMYAVVVKRIHRQYKLNDSGRLSHYNKRWLFWLIIWFVFSLFSGFFFITDAPIWEDWVWILIWASIPGYYFVFLIFQHFFKKEYAPKFYKASAIKWTSISMTVILCVVYACLSMYLAGDNLARSEMDFRAFIDSQNQPLKNATCALLSEASKITTYLNCISEYVLYLTTGTSVVLILIAKIALSASIFWGIISQLGACLLSKTEIQDEFRLLPNNPAETNPFIAKDNQHQQADMFFIENSDEIEGRPYRWQYGIAILAIFAVFFSGFLVLDSMAKNTRDSGALTPVDSFIDRVSSTIENNKRAIKHDEGVKKYRENIDTFVSKNEPAVRDSINDYYQTCIDHADSYVDWYYGFFGSAAKITGSFGEDAAINEFSNLIINSGDKKTVEENYANYISGLKENLSSYANAQKEANGDDPINLMIEKSELSKISNYLDLWPSLNEENKSNTAQTILLYTEDGLERDEIKAKIVTFIEDERAQAIAALENATGEF